MPLTGLRRVVVASAAATLVGVLTFLIVGWTGRPATGSVTVPDATLAPSVTVDALPASKAEATPTTRPTGLLRARSASLPKKAPAVATPTRLRIPTLDADLRVLPVGLDKAGAMALPESPWQAGWYRFGSSPGARGATVIAAHVDAVDTGRGPLAGLARLKAGAAIEVVVEGATLRYRVTKVVRVDKDAFDADAVFARTGPERLHVVTCGGRYDRATGGYDDNVIAIAVPVVGTR
ncbi:MAG TPA: class F sortase [Propionibacteriaceae bacterium]|nr:class F sortase [Propionibacteriaceae bacterium]